MDAAKCQNDNILENKARQGLFCCVPLTGGTNSLLTNAAAPNASPGFTKFSCVVLPWVKQKRCAAVYLPTVSKISHLIWLHDEALRLVSRDLGNDDPPIPGDFIQRDAEWDEVTLKSVLI